MTPAPSPLSIFESRLEDKTPGMNLYKAFGAQGAPADAAIQTITSIVDAAQTVVDVLADADGTGYRIGFADATATGINAPAFTVMAERKIVISPKVFADPTLSLPIIATVLTGLVAHEVGHTKVTPGLRKLREAKWPNAELPVLVSTIFEDRRLELRQTRDFPGLEESFDMTLWWAAREVFATKTFTFDPANDPLGDRVNFAIAASRYRKYTPGITSDAVTQDEAAWWLALYESVNVGTTDDQMIDITVKALHRLLDNLPPEPEPPTGDDEEPPTTTCGPEGPTGEKPDDDEEPPKGKGKGKGNGKPTDEDGEPDPEDQPDDEPKGDDDGPTTEGGDDDGGDPDGEGKGEGKGGGTSTSGKDNRASEDDLKSRDERKGPKDSNDWSDATGQGVTEGDDSGNFDDTVDSHFSPEEKAKVSNPIDDSTKVEATDGAIAHYMDRAMTEERETLRVNEAEFGTLKVRLIL